MSSVLFLVQKSIHSYRQSKDKYEKTIYRLPKKLDKEVVRLHLKKIGVVPTKLTDARAPRGALFFLRNANFQLKMSPETHCDRVPLSHFGQARKCVSLPAQNSFY